MIQLLKHTALRLWLTLAVGCPLGIGLLAVLNEPAGTAWPLSLMAATLIGVFILLGWGCNRLGQTAISRHLSESGILERAGRTKAAEVALKKAVGLYDSFLISPLARRRLAEPLVERLARFHLGRPDRRVEGLDSVRAYLTVHPENRSMAEAWMRWIEQQARVEPGDEDLIGRVATAQSDDSAVQQMLGRHCLLNGRTDFQALEIYRRVIGRDSQTAQDWTRRLAVLFLNEGRADEHALETYLTAWDGGGDREELRRGLAACLSYLPEGDENRDRLALARQHLAGLDAVDLEILSEGFKDPGRFERPKDIPPRERHQSLRMFLVRAGLWLSLTSVRLRQSWALRRGLVWFAGAGAVAALVLLLINTMGHLMVPEPAPAPPVKAEPQVVVAPDPYTIQVAAYLKKEHAQRFVDELRAQKVDARWSEAQGKNKTWYQVRVSHFPDKESALTYGETIKRQGLIDDFYVANNETQ